MMLIYNGDFSELIKLNYNECKYGSYFFKTINRWSAIFIDAKTREITVEGCTVDNQYALAELDKIKEYIKEVGKDDTRR